MSVNKIFDGLVANQMTSVSKVGGGSNYNTRLIKTDLNTQLITQEELRLNPTYPNYVWSSGTNINEAGQIVFAAASGYGILSDVTIINRGPNVAFVGINNTNVGVSGVGGTSLGTNESLYFDDSVHVIWVSSASGNVNVEVNGISSHNRNII